MSPLLKPVCIHDPAELVELLSEAMGEVVSGGILLDGAVGNEEFGFFDLVAADSEGEGVFFFINISGNEAEYLRLLKCMRWYRENRLVLQKLYAGKAALGPAPSVFVIAPRYSSSMRKVLLNLSEGRITLMRYACFQHGDERRSLFLEKEEDSAPAEIPGSVQDEKTTPAAGRTGTGQAESITDPGKIREEAGPDVSNVSDEELSDLLG